MGFGINLAADNKLHIEKHLTENVINKNAVIRKGNELLWFEYYYMVNNHNKDILSGLLSTVDFHVMEHIRFPMMRWLELQPKSSQYFKDTPMLGRCVGIVMTWAAFGLVKPETSQYKTFYLSHIEQGFDVARYVHAMHISTQLSLLSKKTEIHKVYFSNPLDSKCDLEAIRKGFNKFKNIIEGLIDEEKFLRVHLKKNMKYHEIGITKFNNKYEYFASAFGVWRLNSIEEVFTKMLEVEQFDLDFGTKVVGINSIFKRQKIIDFAYNDSPQFNETTIDTLMNISEFRIAEKEKYYLENLNYDF